MPSFIVDMGIKGTMCVLKHRSFCHLCDRAEVAGRCRGAGQWQSGGEEELCLVRTQGRRDKPSPPGELAKASWKRWLGLERLAVFSRQKWGGFRRGSFQADGSYQARQPGVFIFV